MHKIPSYLKQIAICLLIGLLLIYRYINIGIEGSEILLFSLYYCYASFALVLSGIRFKGLINPISIFVPFLFLLSYSLLILSYEQVFYSTTTFFVINISIITYLLFASLNYPFKPVRVFSLNNSLKRKMLYSIVLMVFFTFLVECAVFGFIPILNITNSALYAETNEKLVPFLHYFILLNPLIPAWGYIFYKEKIISKRSFRIVLYISLFILLNYLSKQLYLLFGMSFFVTYTFYNSLNVKSLVKAIAVMVLLLGTVGYLRLDSELSMSANEFYRAIAGIENENISILEALFVEYSSKRFSVLDQMIEYSDQISFFGYGTYTFRPLTSFLLLEKAGVIVRINELNSESKVGTFLIDPYLDFGFIGVFILNAFYGYLAVRYYNQFRNKYPEAAVKFTIIIFCILMGMFVNYFNSMMIWLGLLFSKLLLGGLRPKNEEV